MTPTKLRLKVIEELENLDLTPSQLIIKFATFLPQSQLEELQDSLHREVF